MYCPNGNYNPYALQRLGLQSLVASQSNLLAQNYLIKATGSLSVYESIPSLNCCSYYSYPLPQVASSFTKSTCCGN